MKAWIVLLVSLFTVGCGCEEIEAGHVGVVKKWSAPVDQVGEGLHITGFGTDIEAVDTRAKSFVVKSDAASKDLQRVAAEVSVQYAINGAQALGMLQKIGNADAAQVLLGPAVHESIKATTAGYTAEELITKRDQVKVQIDQSIRSFVSDMLKARDIPNLVNIINVAITDFDFSPEFNASIEAKVKAEQDSLRAENEKQKKIIEAQAKEQEVRVAADAELYRVKQSADAQAYEMKVSSEAKALAVKKVSDAMNAAGPGYIKLKWIERWKGDVAKITTQSAPMLMVNPE
jgi:regulator of protease activity HflC (stomatin/prohibitin superfamily)